MPHPFGPHPSGPHPFGPHIDSSQLSRSLSRRHHSPSPFLPPQAMPHPTPAIRSQGTHQHTTVVNHSSQRDDHHWSSEHDCTISDTVRDGFVCYSPIDHLISSAPLQQRAASCSYLSMPGSDGLVCAPKVTPTLFCGLVLEAEMNACMGPTRRLREKYLSMGTDADLRKGNQRPTRPSFVVG